ncbi:UDP-N-acetyl-D-mannosamine dehydrogenase [Salinivibrio proteolyticus]|uniref:UDP-N-acetyl-D-mannosamine dehydrogenase n=1 Tax=Salinivibrio proteolyticus TaxID=334715 RepID=UPI00098958DF|nr:UDP-N-acetyl-D-mannosamine dehydrogenase [Salinivibrio proteolyticus]OOF20868.1 UDP-N-acetyl-D-mannosamine dehydrogenase [Salinivibrio proteolyticus]
MSFKTISVVGLGYIGLPTAAMFASRKKKVIGVDINRHAVDTINQGKIHIVEPELDKLVQAAVKGGYLKATLTPEPADAFLIAVPTPFLPCNEGEIPTPDLSYIKAASKAIAPVLKKGDLVILESTSPVGATEKMADWLSEARVDLTFPQTHGKDADVNISHCPERVLPGHVVRELVENDRVIGGLTSKCSQRSVELYQIFIRGECVVTNARTAEMTKLTENSFRDVQIAFANELSIICDKLDINVWELIALANHHPRVNILQPGPGVGGHCIAVDPWFIVSQFSNEARIIKQARNTNEYKANWCLEKINKEISRFETVSGRNAIVACMGLSFKPNIDDLRESPAKYIHDVLREELNNEILAVEPNISHAEGAILCTLDYAKQNADILVFLVNHNEFSLFSNSGNKIILDFCGALN